MSSSRITGLILSPQPEDGTSWYRCEGPFADLEHRHPELIFIREKTVSWPEVLRADFVFMQRPIGSDSVEAARQIVRMGKPLWIDWDDNLMAVPEYNPAWHPEQARLEATVRELADLATVITVSTNPLRQVYRGITVPEKVHLIRNGLDLRYYDCLHRPVLASDRQTTVLWRGSPSHREGLEFYTEAIVDLAKEYPDVHWVFQGWRPHQLFSQIPSDRIRHLAWEGIPDCFYRQYELAPDILFATLLPTPFDYARSQIAALEGVMSGAVVVGPAWGEWETNEYRYSPGNVPDFRKALGMAFQTSRAVRLGLNRQKYKKVREEHSLALRNEKRRKLIRALLQLPVRKIAAVPERDIPAVKVQQSIME